MYLRSWVDLKLFKPSMLSLVSKQDSALTVGTQNLQPNGAYYLCFYVTIYSNIEMNKDMYAGGGSNWILQVQSVGLCTVFLRALPNQLNFVTELVNKPKMAISKVPKAFVFFLMQLKLIFIRKVLY